MRYLSRMGKKKLRGTAILRLDFNTADEWRMQAVLPTIRFLLRRGAKILIVSHRGRPVGIKIVGGRPQNFDKNLSLRRDAAALSRLLGKKVIFIPHFRFAEIKKRIGKAEKGAIFLLENIRFLRQEITPAPELAKSLAELGDYFVNDAFAVCHRPSDSVAKIEHFLPSYAGLELEKEIKILSRVMRRPKLPLVVVIGGAKAGDKLGVIKFFRRRAAAFLLGGAAANTLLRLQGIEIGRSLVDKTAPVKELKKLLTYPNLFLPPDWKMEEGAILDIGKKTAKLYAAKIKNARTVIWAGPMGYIEKAKFSRGSLAVAKAIAANRRAFSVAGGGETVAFLRKHRLAGKISFISTGGGAMLEFLAGRKLPGIEALK